MPAVDVIDCIAVKGVGFSTDIDPASAAEAVGFGAHCRVALVGFALWLHYGKRPNAVVLALLAHFSLPYAGVAVM